MNKKFLVSGNTNIETTLAINEFPIDYSPIRFSFNGVKTTISGGGINLAFSLKTLGGEVNYLSMIGKNYLDKWVIEVLKEKGIGSDLILECLDEIPNSVILYDEQGRRQINIDPKDLQEQTIPEKHYVEALKNCDVALLSNMNYNRPLLQKAHELEKTIAIDIGVIDAVNNDYNKEFMSYADILFFSNERIQGREEEFIKLIYEEYKNDIIVIGMGKEGALIHIKNENKSTHYPAVDTREIVSTVGAGDSLFSSFVYNYTKTADPHISLRKAIIYASYKIGEKGGAEGFITEAKLDNLYNEIYV